MTRKYELSYLVSRELSEEELKSFCDKIGAFVAEEMSIIEHQSNPLKKRLAFSIKGKTEAYLISLAFKTDSKNIENIEKKLKAENQILRYIMIIRESPKKIRERTTRIFPKTAGSLQKKFDSDSRGGMQKIEIGDIDKKIEEILSE